MKNRVLKTVFIMFVLSVFSAVACFAAGWVSDGGDNWMYVDNDGNYVRDTIKASGNDKYYLDVDGKMVRDYLDGQKDLTYRAGGEYEGGGGCTVVIFK